MYKCINQNTKYKCLDCKETFPLPGYLEIPYQIDVPLSVHEPPVKRVISAPVCPFCYSKKFVENTRDN